MDESQAPQLVVEYVAENQSFRVKMDPTIPQALLVNMLEVLKAQLILAQLEQMAKVAQRQVNNRIVMPDGRPL